MANHRPSSLYAGPNGVETTCVVKATKSLARSAGTWLAMGRVVSTFRKAHVSEHRHALLPIAAIVLSACVAQIGDAPGKAGGDPSDPNNTGNTTGSGGTSNPTDLGGLPCDVAALIETHCLVCHGSPINQPPALGSLDALMAPAPKDPSRTVAEVALDSMRGIGIAMPPNGPQLSDADIAPFADWIAAGMPAGDCGSAPTGPDPFAVDPVCTTNTYWNQGNEGSRQMHPGVACIKCHQSSGGGEGPQYQIAGTVYPTGHEPDDCYGNVGDLQGAYVAVTDANGQQLQLAVGNAGNFYLEQGNVAFPISVKVVYGGKEIAMPDKLQVGQGDCNDCHTQNGANNAPGRIILPP